MSMQNSAALNARYGIPEQLSFKDTPGGLIVAEVNNAHAMASIALQGAHLMTWAPKGELPVIWLSEDAKLAPGKSIRALSAPPVPGDQRFRAVQLSRPRQRVRSAHCACRSNRSSGCRRR